METMNDTKLTVTLSLTEEQALNLYFLVKEKENKNEGYPALPHSSKLWSAIYPVND